MGNSASVADDQQADEGGPLLEEDGAPTTAVQEHHGRQVLPPVGIHQPRQVELPRNASTVATSKGNKAAGPPPATPIQFQRPQLTDSTLGALPFIKAIQDIFVGKGLEKFLDDLSPRDLVEYVVHHSTHIASDERKLSIIGQKLAQIPVNSENQTAFASLRFRDALLSVATTIRETDTVYWLASGLLAVTASASNVRLYAFRPLRNTLVHLAWHAKSPAAVDVVGQLFAKFSEGGDNDLLFATAAVRDAFCCMADHCLSPTAICAWCTALLNTAASPESAELFCVPEIRAAALKVANATHSADAALAICALLAAMAFTDSGRRLLGTRNVLDALIALADHAVVPEAVECWAKAVLYISSDAANRALFGVEPMHDALVRLTEHATTPNAVQWLCRAVAGLCLLQANENMLCSRLMRGALQRMGHTVMRCHGRRWGQTTQRGASGRDGFRNGPLAMRLSTADTGGEATQRDDASGGDIAAQEVEDITSAAMWLCNAVINLTSTDEHKLRMSHERVRDALVDAGPVCFDSSMAQRALTHALLNITKCTQHPQLFASRSFRTLVTDAADALRDSESATALLGTIVAMTRADDNKLLCGGGRMHACLVALADLVQSAECACMWWKAVASVCHVELNRSNFALDRENVVTALLVVVRASRSADSIVAMGRAFEVLCSVHYGDRIVGGLGHHSTGSTQQLARVERATAPQGTTTRRPSSQWPTSVVAAARKFAKHTRDNQHDAQKHQVAQSALGRGAHQHLHQVDALRNSTSSPVFTAGAYFLPCSDFRDALLSIHSYALTADAVRWFSHTLYMVAMVATKQGEHDGGGTEDECNEPVSVLCTVAVRDALIAVSRSAHDADAVRWLCKLLNTLARHSAFRELLVSTHLQKALVDMKRSATTPDAVHQLSGALSVVTKLMEDSSFAEAQEGLGVALLEDALLRVRGPSQRVAGAYFYQQQS